MSQAPRRRGRPKGSKNKKVNLSGATVEKICEYHKFNPAEKLIAIATGTDDDTWDKGDRLRATTKLFDAIHGTKSLPGGIGGEVLDGQFELVFVEDSAGFTLPGETDAEGIAQALREQQVQCIGDTPQGGKDSLCD